MSRVYDRMMAVSEEACLQAWRAELLREITGEVLEVGAGTGASVALYGPAVTRLVLAEPDRHMRGLLESRVAARGGDSTVVSPAPVEVLPFEDASFDVVVSFLVLCSVGDLDAAIAEIRRVLRPGGRLVFLEHVAAETNPGRLRWQRRIEPIWRACAGNCHLTRRTAEHLEQGGFVLEDVRRESIRKAMPLARPSVRGTARLR